ncbi:MAG: hypothetical protein AAB645_02880 [Patescibacteria group bacterium]
MAQATERANDEELEHQAKDGVAYFLFMAHRAWRQIPRHRGAMNEVEMCIDLASHVKVILLYCGAAAAVKELIRLRVPAYRSFLGCSQN